MTKSPIGFLGLGLLGAAIANNLLDAGEALRIYNRTARKVDPFVARGAARAEAPGDAASPGGTVISCLWDSASVEDVATALADRLGPGGVHISMTTIAPDASQRIAAVHAARGADFVEAPVFGRPEAAAARQLWLPIAGPAAAKARVRPLLTAMGAQGVFDLGETIGSALAVKIAGNFMIGAAARSFAEAMAMIRGRGDDVGAAIDMLTRSLFAAPIFQNYGKLIASGAPTLARSPIIEKDLGLFLAAAAAADSPTPIAAHLLGLMQ